MHETGEKKNAYRVLVGNSEVPRSLGRPCRRCGDRIKMDLGETGWGCGLDSPGS
jgi:hypothetical protein